jgi:hypothetical protein
VKLPTRLGFTIKPDLKSLVLVSKGARISRPKTKIDGLDAIIKNDMLFKTIDKSVDDANPLVMAKIVGRDTLEALARDIVKLHKPIAFNWHAKFGLAEPPLQAAPTLQTTEPADDTHKPKQKLICNSCGEPVPYNVAKFCWFNKPKFGGNLYCMACQKKV